MYCCVTSSEGTALSSSLSVMVASSSTCVSDSLLSSSPKRCKGSRYPRVSSYHREYITNGPSSGSFPMVAELSRLDVIKGVLGGSLASDSGTTTYLALSLSLLVWCSTSSSSSDSVSGLIAYFEIRGVTSTTSQSVIPSSSKKEDCLLALDTFHSALLYRIRTLPIISLISSQESS